MKVLVVEDELLQAFDVMDSLEAGGHTPIGPAPDATAALYFAERNKPDFALVDITLRHGDKGYDVARELHDQFDVPVMFLTAQCDTARAHRDNALGCLHKPITAAGVLGSVDAAANLVEGKRPVELPANVELYV